MNDVLPAVAPAELNAVVDTVGRVTVKSPPLPVVTSQVVAVISPLNVIVPSAANADAEIDDAMNKTKSDFFIFNLC